MFKALTESWFVRPWRGRRRAAGIDAADHGTAFGLELSLLPLAAMPTPRASIVRAGWLRRIALRRRLA